jgi:cellulose synthase/poly-beta-1,6-N-acetylglucosamine synthase-like glycosyltransferase/peptidoglycan/xylan/chitin deacetylase (PgdA/CDA1 family)
MAQAVFHDPQRRRWRRLRPAIDIAGAAITVAVIVFCISLMKRETLPALTFPGTRPPLKAIKEKERRRAPYRATHRKSKSSPSQVVLNTDEGIRAAFYVTWDAGSFSALKDYVHQIDLLFPEWLHMLSPDGRLQAASSDGRSLYDVIRSAKVQQVDDKVMPFLAAEKADTEVFPLVNNYNPLNGGGEWIDISAFLRDPQARAEFRRQLDVFLSSDKYRGISLDFEDVPTKSQPAFKTLVNELDRDLHARGMKLYVNVPADDDDWDYGYLAAHSDGIILMNYDEHSTTSGAGPIASQEWFTKNLQEALKVVPRDKLICGIGNYAYDWRGKKKVDNLTVETAWLNAYESESEIDFHPDSLNPHFAYLEGNERHDVWLLDAVTALNEMRAANQLGIRTFALWRLGSEDRSLWSVWDQPSDKAAPEKLRNIHPGYDVDYEGSGEVLHIAQRPTIGERQVTIDEDSGLIDSESMEKLPLPYKVDQYGASAKQIALTFDDGPDPNFTPQILNIMKAKGVKATFFVIGWEAEQFPSLMKRTYREGHEIGNHTFYHPDIGNISRRYMEVELNSTERLFAAKIGVKPLLFRPPYAVDQEPDTADQVRPLEIAQDMGYITVGDKIDPNDWRDNPHRTAEQIASDIFDHLPPCQDGDQRCGNIVLLHDGGGDRSQTVRALPMIIDGLRQRGYSIVGVSQLLGKQRADIMPPITENEIWSARINNFVFWLYGVIYSGIVIVFFVGDTLMTLRLFMVGSLAIYDRIRERVGKKFTGSVLYWPAVAVLIPAYNEEKVIVNTVRAALDSKYPKLRVIVVDDGSTDRTFEVASETFRTEVAEGKVLVLTKRNAGKASALNYGLAHVDEEIFVGIDADTMIATNAICRLVPHFENPEVAAVAGNTKVGNRVNLWTRWQALEYITSQNFERRALDVFGAVTVVPGALGAWRTQLVRDAGGYHEDTVAEDADLTMSLLERGGRVYYEDRALAFTEAPTRASGLMRQRFRWSFGILQAVWKHRAAFGRKGTLGWIALPNIFIFQIILPLVSPFIDLMFAFGALSYGVNRYFHPETAHPTEFLKLVVFFLAFLVIDFIASAIAFSLERRETDHEDVWLLGHVWLQRFAYRQLFSIVLFKTLKRAIDGRPFSWEKLERTAAVSRARVVAEQPVGRS